MSKTFKDLLLRMVDTVKTKPNILKPHIKVNDISQLNFLKMK